MSTHQIVPPPPTEERPPAFTPPPTPGTASSLEALLRRSQRVLIRPSMQKMAAERQGANWATIWYSLLGLALVQALVALFEHAEAIYWNALAASPQFVQYMHTLGVRNVVPRTPGTGVLEAFLGAFIGFFLMVGLVYLAAKVLGGSGSFLEHSYLLALIYVPLQLIASVAGLVPVLGGLVGAAAAIYMVVLVVMAVASVHRLTIGTAVVAVILPVILTVLLVVVLAAIVAIIAAIAVLLFHL
jgi:hypothetical protein